jgi:hypothetical protein
MHYLKRYHNGEYQQVWGDLQALGHVVRQEPHYSEAREVAAETMRRVRRNCERIASRLRSLGYAFDTYPDGTRRSYTPEPLAPPSEATLADIAELEAQAGPLPLSLTAFWHEVGSVDFVGMHPSWPAGLDPLVVDPPEGSLSFLYDEEGDEEIADSGWFAGLAPDDLHKDNTSGGDPYGLKLPDPSADFMLMYERHELLFVPYLRMAILRWGGFPGLEGQSLQLAPLADLVAGLEPF